MQPPPTRNGDHDPPDMALSSSRKRLHRADRRALILDAASAVFAEHGYDGAKTQQIATAAKVSEALVYRHFPTKLALYKAVLRKVVHDQDAVFNKLGFAEPNVTSLIGMIDAFIGSCVEGAKSSAANGMRILFASLAGDGDYARLVYRRASKLSLQSFTAAVAAARISGDLTGAAMSASNMHAFIEHVGSMILMARMPKPPVVAYEGDKQRVASEAVRFICRGIGLSDAAITHYYSGNNSSREPSRMRQAQ